MKPCMKIIVTIMKHLIIIQLNENVMNCFTEFQITGISVMMKKVLFRRYKKLEIFHLYWSFEDNRN